MTFNTGNNVPSTDPRDLYDNAENLDKLVNGVDPFYADRKGVLRQSWAGMENDFDTAQEGRENTFTLSQADKESRFQEFLVSSGYVSKGDYAAGVVLEQRNEYVAVDAATTGTSPGLYRPNASATLPLTLTGTWATDSANLVLLGDDVLRQELSSPTGSERVGRGDSTVDGDITLLEERAGTIESELAVPSGRLSSIARESLANAIMIKRRQPERVTGKALYEATYDHFGQMDALPDGQLYLIFRRAAAHTGGSDGNLMFSKLLPTGSWASPTLIADIAGQDFRDAAGGTMPSGRIICASTIYETGDLHVYASDDYGVSWTLKQTILKGSTDYRFAHGKGFQIGSKYVVPYYTATGAVFQLRWLETTDGGETWTEGATVYSGDVDYNETAYLPLGGGAVLGVARVGAGTGGKLRQFISTDGGATWTDQGDVTAQNGDATDVLVAPSMSYVLSEGGTPHVVLFYTNRTAGFCYYRVNTVDKVIAGVTGWSDRTSVYSAPGSSGYSSQIVLGDRRILGNVYRELSLSGAGAYQFEVRLGELPDYESQWTAVAASTLYTFAHGLQRAPRRVVVEFAASANPSVWFTVGASFYNDGANKGSGAQVEIGATNIRVGTGASVWGTGYFAGIDFAADNRLASGFYRVRAWI